MNHRYSLVTALVICLLVCASLFGTPRAADAGTFYVATDGSDANPGSYDAPWATIQSAVSQLSAGDTLYIRGGVYSSASQNVDSQAAWVPSGNSWDDAITIAGYPGETVTIRPPNGSPGLRLTWGQPHYLIFQDLALDMSQQADDFDPMVADKVEAIYVASGAHHLRFQRLDVGYTMSNAIQWSTHEVGQYSSYLELLDSRIHHAGLTTRDSGHGGPGINNGYGIYLFTDDNRVEGNEFYGNCGIAINAYGNRNVISYNTAHDNGTRGGPAPAINIGSSAYPGLSTYNVVSGNVVYNNRAGIQIYSNTVATMVSGNTIYANQMDGVLLAYYDSVSLYGNVVYGNGEANILDWGGASAPVLEGNVSE